MSNLDGKGPKKGKGRGLGICEKSRENEGDDDHDRLHRWRNRRRSKSDSSMKEIEAQSQLSVSDVIDFDRLREISERGDQTYGGFPMSSSYDFDKVPEMPSKVKEVPSDQLRGMLEKMLMPRGKDDF